MRYFQQILILAIFMQLLISCWARARFLSHPWAISPYHWNDIEGSDANNNDFEFIRRTMPLFMNAKRSMRNGFHHSHEDRRDKYLGETTKLQGGRSLQGLWAMPGRR